VEGERIPNRFGHFFENVNPPLALGGVPDGAHSLVLVMDGPDAPGGEYTHWLVWNIPPDTGTVPEGWDPPEGVVQGGNSPGGSDYGYVGPDPPNKQWYRFKLYAVAEPVGLSRVAFPAAAVAFAVLAAAGRAMAHPGGGDSGADHLIVEGIGYLVAAFLAYLAFSFARRVLYPRVRGYFQ
jgi:Raf kinase inhibitor-like YbhB/YbcL family protein